MHKGRRTAAYIAIILALFLIPQATQAKLFPKDFAWGVAGASYQIEGAWDIDGKGLSIWDIFSHTPGRIALNQTGDVADDFYHRYTDDIAMMKQLGIKHFRMSLSWPRLLPNGTVDNVNVLGVEFYNALLDALLAADIEPFVTLYHWDLPNDLNDKTSNGGWLNPEIINHFNDYADFCFKTFGDKVKHWLTFNEISTFSWIGYGSGVHAPGRCSPDFGNWCESVGGGGNSSTEPYIVAHHVLIAHGLAVQTYRTKYQTAQNGSIGLTISAEFAEPWDPTNEEDVKGVETSILFQVGWFADPIVFGRYPDIMVEYITGNRLPTFNETERALIKGSFDFIGLNHYSTGYIHYTGIPGTTYDDDSRVIGNTTDVHGHLIGPFAASDWINVYPPGIRGILNWVDNRYNHPPLYIFENGVSCHNETTMEQALNDTFRVDYLKGYISYLVLAVMEDNVDLRGYFTWSIMDNFEWADGYGIRFGLVYVDYDNNATRHLKKSATFYSNLINIMADPPEKSQVIMEIIENETFQFGSLIE